MLHATTWESCPAELLLSAAASEDTGKDARLLEQLKQQNRRGLERVMKRYTAYVGTILRNVTRGQTTQEDLEELTADVFLALWHHAPEMRTEHLTGYLASIARSKGYNWLRKNRRYRCFGTGRAGGTGGHCTGNAGTAAGTGSGTAAAVLFLPPVRAGNCRRNAHERIHRENQNVPQPEKTAAAVHRKGLWL